MNNTEKNKQDKKQMSRPELQVILFDAAENVIATSGEAPLETRMVRFFNPTTSTSNLR